MKTKLLLGCSFGSSLLTGGCIDVNKAVNTATQTSPMLSSSMLMI